MRRLVRNPLTWMVVAELVVVTALVLMAWSAIAQAARPATGSSALNVDSPAAGDTASPIPSVPAVHKPGSNVARPGLNVDPAFWLNRLQGLNRDQVYFEQLEWRLVHAGMDAAQRYLETVVLPSVRNAERSGSAPGL
ncbi:MAG TPA: hypothetical protein VGG31_06980 [Candidatus Dormibacteraeota bacterium]|jgi:hypothetical protein